MQNTNQLPLLSGMLHALLDEKKLLLTYLIACAPDCRASGEQLSEVTGDPLKDIMYRMGFLVKAAVLSPDKKHPAYFTLSRENYTQVQILLEMADMDRLAEPYLNKLIKVLLAV
jgi:hypothetical protein